MRKIDLPQEAVWTYLKEPGMEHLLLAAEGSLLWADGFMLGTLANNPYRIRYTLRFTKEWKVREVRLELSGRTNKRIDKFITDDGKWTAFFEEEDTALSGCFAVGISASPVTRSLVLRQLSLSLGETSDIQVACLDIPNLKLQLVTHRYICLKKDEQGTLYRCENLCTGEQEDMQLDAEELLQDSPNILKRIWVD